MAPGIGSVVVYHYISGSYVVDIPAIVAATPNTWVSGSSPGWSTPSAGTVDLIVFLPETGVSPRQSVSEGTSGGEYSVPTVTVSFPLETDDVA